MLDDGRGGVYELWRDTVELVEYVMEEQGYLELRRICLVLAQRVG